MRPPRQHPEQAQSPPRTTAAGPAGPVRSRYACALTAPRPRRLSLVGRGSQGVLEPAGEPVDEPGDAFERVRRGVLAPDGEVGDRVAGGVEAEEPADGERDRLGDQLLGRVVQLRVVGVVVEATSACASSCTSAAACWLTATAVLIAIRRSRGLVVAVAAVASSARARR